MYKVIRYFTDLQDNNYPYNEGDIFPRDGLTVSKERYNELSGSHNKQKTPLIKKVKDDFSKSINSPGETTYTKTDINRMSKEDLVSLANEVGIIGAEDKSGSDLKKELIEKFGL